MRRTARLVVTHDKTLGGEKPMDEPYPGAIETAAKCTSDGSGYGFSGEESRVEIEK
jgi:hypothetical protein